MEIEEIETGKFRSFYKPEPKEKAKPVPDLTNQGGTPRRGDPFILTDFKGIDAYQKPT